MLPWNVARSRAPAQLSNPVGAGARNLKHDVALVQALLRAARLPGGGAYYGGPIDGRYAPAFAEALARFRAERAAATGVAPLGPLYAWDPAFQALARLDPTLAVLYGTTTVYGSTATERPSHIDQRRETIELSSQMLQALQSVLADIRRTTAILLDLELRLRRGEGSANVTLATLQPRGLRLLTADGRLNLITSPGDLQRGAPELAKALRDVFDNLMAQRVGLSAAARMQNASRTDLLTFVLRSAADRIEKQARDLVNLGREWGLTTAARFFEFYLDGKGRGDPNQPDIVLSQFEALSFAAIRQAHAENIRRFTEETPKKKKEKKTLGRKFLAEVDALGSAVFRDHWDYLFRYPRIPTSLNGPPPNLRLLEQMRANPDFFLAAGETTFTSTANFTVSWDYELLLIEAEVTHNWADIFDFHIIYGAQARFLERDGRARPFAWQARWDESYAGKMNRDFEWVAPLRPRL